MGMSIARAVDRAIGRVVGMLVVLAALLPAHSQQETPEDLEFLEELRTAMRRGGSYAAQRDLEEYLADFPGSPAARRLAAQSAGGRGRLVEALAHLDAVGGADPVLRGRLLLRLGRAEEALALARQIR
jgi:hypothetical protein